MLLILKQCNPLVEILFSAAFMSLIVTVAVSGFITFNNRSEQDKKGFFWQYIVGGTDIYLTDKYLNEKGKFWRKIYLASIFTIILFVTVSYLLKICQ